jgi:4-hydroxybenzoate polyprenyltransferase
MKQCLIIFRPYGMLFLGLTPVFGALANGEFAPLNLIILLIIGLLAHIFTFVQNDYYDIEIDSKSKYVANRPLSSGDISKKTVIFIFISALLVSLILSVFLFNIYSFLVLILSFICMTLYNKYSKRLAGMEYILSLGVFFYGLFGALTVATSISNLAILVGSFVFLQWLFSVGISANLKDVEFDTKLGIKTTPVWFGVHISGKSLVVSFKFKVYSYSIKIIHILIAFFIFTLYCRSSYVFNISIAIMIFIIISLILIYLTHKILTTTLKKRDTMLKYMGLQEGLSFLLLPVSMLSLLIEIISFPITTILLIVMILWPLIWFRILYGKSMIPLE